MLKVDSNTFIFNNDFHGYPDSVTKAASQLLQSSINRLLSEHGQQYEVDEIESHNKEAFQASHGSTVNGNRAELLELNSNNGLDNNILKNNIPSINFSSIIPPKYKKYPNGYLEAIGSTKTPLLRLQELCTSHRVPSQYSIYAKCEFMNPGGSLACHRAKRLVEDFETEFCDEIQSQNQIHRSLNKILSNPKNQIPRPSPTLIFPSLGLAGALVATCKGFPSVTIGNEDSSSSDVFSKLFTAYGAFLTAQPTEDYTQAPEKETYLDGSSSRIRRNRNHLDLQFGLDSDLDFKINQAKKLKEIVPHSVIIPNPFPKTISQSTGRKNGSMLEKKSKTSIISEIADSICGISASMPEAKDSNNSPNKSQDNPEANNANLDRDLFVCSENCFIELASYEHCDQSYNKYLIPAKAKDQQSDNYGTLTWLLKNMETVIIGEGEEPNDVTKLYLEYLNSLSVSKNFRLNYHQIKKCSIESYEMTKSLILQEGLLCSPSAGAVLQGAFKAIKEIEIGEKRNPNRDQKSERNKKVVIVLDENLGWYSPVGLKFLSNDWIQEQKQKDKETKTVSNKVELPVEPQVQVCLDEGKDVETAIAKSSDQDVMDNWWIEQVVGDIRVKQPAVLDPDMSIQEAILALQTLENEQAVVQLQIRVQTQTVPKSTTSLVSVPPQTNVILGITTLSHLESKLASGSLKPLDTLGTHGAIFRNFHIVKFETKLGDLIKTTLREHSVCIVVQQIFECSQNQIQNRTSSQFQCIKQDWENRLDSDCIPLPGGSGSGNSPQFEQAQIQNQNLDLESPMSIKIQNRRDVVLGLITEFDIMEYIAKIEEHHLNKCPNWKYHVGS